LRTPLQNTLECVAQTSPTLLVLGRRGLRPGAGRSVLPFARNQHEAARPLGREVSLQQRLSDVELAGQRGCWRRRGVAKENDGRLKDLLFAVLGCQTGVERRLPGFPARALRSSAGKAAMGSRDERCIRVSTILIID